MKPRIGDKMPGMGDVTDLKRRRVYSFRQIDDILHLPPSTASRWIDGYYRGGRLYEPVVRPERTGDPVATWGELIECRLLAEYRGSGVSLQRMRPAVQKLREMTGSDYPLASARLWVAPDGRELVASMQAEVGLERALNLVIIRNGQSVMDWSPKVLNFQKAVDWSSAGSDAQAVSITPDRNVPLVVVDPLRGYGDPVIRGRNVTTRVIADLLRSGETVRQVGDNYDLTSAQVEAAMRFELLHAS